MKLFRSFATACAAALCAWSALSTNAQTDLVSPPEMSQKAAAKLRGLGTSAEVFVIEGDGGHLD
jgi:hypothetical protein